MICQARYNMKIHRRYKVSNPLDSTSNLRYILRRKFKIACHEMPIFHTTQNIAI